MIQTPEFQNQTVLVTGASAGIGAAAAHAFGSRGAHVIVHYNSRPEAAAQAVAGIESAAHLADLAREAVNNEFFRHQNRKRLQKPLGFRLRSSRPRPSSSPARAPVTR